MTDDLANVVIGPCRLKTRIGRGGMGSVFSAEMIEDRPYAARGALVAVKVMDAAEVPAQRFRREARLGTTLRHDGIARTHEAVVETRDGRVLHALVMELLEGRTLREALDEEGALPEPIVRDLGAQVAEALFVVHAAGAVHADIKPSNLLVTNDGHVKLLDLGVARLRAADRDGSGHFAGSPAYAAPEQIRCEELGAAGDLYSLGVTLHEAVAGARPFDSDGPAEIARLHATATAPRLGDLVADVSPFLEELVATLLAKEPAARVIADLAATFRDGESSAWWRARLRALRASAARSRLPRISVRRDTPVVGRSDELRALAAWHAEAAGGAGRVVLVQGEAGVGKSRVLSEFVDVTPALADGHVLHVVFSPGSADARGRVAQAIVDLLGAETLTGRLRDCLDDERAAIALAAYLLGEPAPPGVQALSRAEVHARTRQVVRALAAENPTTILVEDLHFAGPDDRALLTAIGRDVPERRMLLLATMRPGNMDDGIADLSAGDHVRRLTVDRLGRERVVELLSVALASRALGEDIARRLGEHADGNPYFVLETLRDLEHRRVLRRGGDGAWILAPGAALDAPASVRGLLIARLDALHASERDVVEAGSIVGHEFDPDLVAHVLQRERSEVMQALATIERRTGIVRGAGASFRFDHHQLQETTRETLGEARGRQLHSLLAAEIARRAGLDHLPLDEVDGHAVVVVASHLLRGDSPRDAAPLLPTAVRVLDRAFAYEATIELTQATVATLGDGDPALLTDMLIKQDESLHRLGRRAEQRAGQVAMLRAARATGDDELLARALCNQARLLLSTAEYTQALEIYEEARLHARAAGWLRGEAQAEQGIGTACRELLRREEGLAHSQRARDLWRELGVTQELGSESVNIGSVLAEMGRYDEAIAACAEGLAVFEGLGSAVHLATARLNYGWIRYCVGDWPGARVLWEQCLGAARERGYPHLIAFGLANLAELDLCEGRLDAAETKLEESLPPIRRTQDRRVEAYAMHRMGDVAAARGQWARAEELFEQAIALWRASSTEGLAPSLMALALVRLELGDAPGAQPLVHEAAELGSGEPVADIGVLPQALLALLGEKDPRSVVTTERCPIRVRIETHAVLHRAGSGDEDRRAALALLDLVSAHLSGDDLEAFRRLSPLARLLA